MDDAELRKRIEHLLGKSIAIFSLKGKGACNNAYYVETEDGDRFIVKKEREDKETSEQNSLAVEAKVIMKLSELDIETPVPEVVFFSENPQMYGYRYIDGENLKSFWANMSEEDRISICKKLGFFHAEIGKKVSKELSENLGIKINDSIDLHPETLEEYEQILSDSEVPQEFKELAEKSMSMFRETNKETFFQFIHYDSHHENILVNKSQIVGIIDFGDAEYGEVAKEFSRYIRDFPYHFEHIISAYEKYSGNKLSRLRLVTHSYLSGLIDNVNHYKAGGERREKSLRTLRRYAELIG